MAGDSYSLEEVSALLAVPVSDLVRRIEEGAFPGRFLTADWEMRIPVQDVRRAVEAMRRAAPRALARAPEGSAGGELDASGFRATLEAWWEERESRLVSELRAIYRREDERWEAVEALLSEVRDRLQRLESGARPSEVWHTDGGWASEIEGSAEGAVESVFAELRDLEELLGLPVDDEPGA